MVVNKLAHALSIGFLVFGTVAYQAKASTLPGLDRTGNTLSVGIMNGIGVGLDTTLSTGTQLGIQGGTSFGWTAPYFGARVVQPLPLPEGSLRLGLMASVLDVSYTALAPATWGGLGLALSYAITPRVTFRASLGDALLLYPAVTPNIYSLFDPNTGFEFGYRFSPRLEGTIGVNGFEQLLGLNYAL